MLGFLQRRKFKSIKQNLIDLGYKIVKEEDGVEIDFETEVLNGFKLRGVTWIYGDDSESEIELGVSVGLYIQNEKFNDFEEYGSIYLEMFSDVKKIIPNLKSLIDNFKKYCGSSSKQAIEYNFDELIALDEKITGNKYRR